MKRSSGLGMDAEHQAVGTQNMLAAGVPATVAEGNAIFPADGPDDISRLLQQMIRCPRCLSPLQTASPDKVLCTKAACLYSETGFFRTTGQLVLIDFSRSIIAPSHFTKGNGSVRPRIKLGGGFRTRIRKIMSGDNPVAAANCERFCSLLKRKTDRPLVLVVGGGARGSGTEALYEDDRIRTVGTDVYASLYTHLVSDGHFLPFANASFDGVWIQAVLEHVLDPHKVVEQIERVLKADGLVYAETPFMQQVHEGAYDFTRFTLSGHRWLFRGFRQVEAGVAIGAGTSAVWTMRYLWRSLGLSDKSATILTVPFFWLRFLDRLAKRRPNADAASACFFLGTKSEERLQPLDMVGYYETQR